MTATIPACAFGMARTGPASASSRMTEAAGKLQTPNSKLQESTKLQTPSPAHGVRSGLKFGAFLEFGVWCLEFSLPRAEPRRGGLFIAAPAPTSIRQTP